MLTLKFKITNINQEDKEFISSLQRQHSVAFRKMYSNIELIEDESFINEIISKHIRSSKAYEYLSKEVIAFKERDLKCKERISKNISSLKEKLKTEKNPRIKQKLQRKISSLISSLNSNVVFGVRKLLQDITRQFKSNPDLYKTNKEKFILNRLLPLTFHGETARKGNRFFDLSQINEGKIIFKYENSKRKVNISFHPGTRSRIDVLNKLSFLCKQKEIPITIKLTTTHLFITYDENKLSGKHFDEKKFYKSIKHITNKDERRTLISEAHRAHEKQMFGTKIQNRFFGMDINPKGIGYCISDMLSQSPTGEFKVIRKRFINLEFLSDKNISADKRKYELSIAMRNLFKELEHHQVCHFVMEELTNISNKDNGNKSSNRQINNIWCRNLIAQLSDKWCSFYGIKKIEINPAYSSFIGNILNNTFDPIAASIEICRRGMIKYIKGGHFLPSFHQGVITEVSQITQMDYNELQSVSSWKEMWKFLQLAKKSVRRAKKSDFLFEQQLQNRTEKSKVQTLSFL